jgi:hypothetical protein
MNDNEFKKLRRYVFLLGVGIGVLLATVVLAGIQILVSFL